MKSLSPIQMERRRRRRRRLSSVVNHRLRWLHPAQHAPREPIRIYFLVYLFIPLFPLLLLLLLLPFLVLVLVLFFLGIYFCCCCCWLVPRPAWSGPAPITWLDELIDGSWWIIAGDVMGAVSCFSASFSTVKRTSFVSLSPTPSPPLSLYRWPACWLRFFTARGCSRFFRNSLRIGSDSRWFSEIPRDSWRFLEILGDS